MMVRKRLLTAAAALCLTVSSAWAQAQPEYRLELGAKAGVATYEGDFNNGLLKNMNPTGGVVVKYKPNPRMAWAADIGYGKLKGNSKKADTWYPATADNPIDFNTSVTDVNVRFEYNFWPYGTGREYRGARRLTPFIALGLGLTFAHYETTQTTQTDKGSVVAGQMPIGLGMKYKMGDRWNLTAEWMMHLTGSDKLDGTADPYGIKSSGLFKNTDCYSVIALSVTYDLWEKCKTCHKE